MGQTLKFGKGTWATKTGSSMAYNDQNGNYKPLPFNVGRDSIATRVNKEGLIEVVGKDKLRIDYTDSAKGVALLENSSTNFITNSNDFTTGWSNLISGSGINPVVTSNQGTSPDGSLNADKVVFDLNGGTSSSDYSLLDYSLSGFSNPHTLDTSIYLKSSDGNDYQVAVYNRGTSVQIITVTSQWQRFSVNGTRSNTTNNFRIGLFGDNSSNTASLLLFGAQAELNSFATSYIPTSGSTYQRQADVVNGSGNSEVFNDSEGVLFADIRKQENGGSTQVISLSDGSTNNNIYLNLSSTPNQINVEVLSSGGQAGLSSTSTNQADQNKFAIKYKVNDFSLWINGFEVDSDNSGNTPVNLSKINFDFGQGSFDFYGKTKELGYYDTALTDEELEYLTSYRSLNELVTELNLNTL